MPFALPPGLLIADGAMGTELQARSGKAGPTCLLNLKAPWLVLALHREYLAVGARLLVANTLGASPEEAVAGIRLAREAVGGQRGIVAAAVVAEPQPDPALVEALAGADLLLLETVTSLAALDLAVAAVHRYSTQSLLATLSFAEDGALDGLSPTAVARRLQNSELEAWGYGCGFGPEHARRVMAEVRQAAPEAVLIVKPNLGLPRNGAYSVSPAQLAAWAQDMAALGVRIIGACCGSTPAHIRAAAGSLID
ncbi:MAG TPA: homocysteine S-methyltransferase family protein [Chloroflexota bacterium]|nr:homocysteine S-methyltransferase family protein [Chloroflexota bacterium]